MALSQRDMLSLSKGIGRALKPYIARLEALEARQDEFKYVGTWKSGREYKAGNFCTHSGSIWHANEATAETPGRSNSWTLAVKSR